jgi:hypothetical protein
MRRTDLTRKNSAMLQVSVIIGVPGSGKTYSLLQKMINEPAKYLVALPRRDFIVETMAPIISKISTEHLPIIINGIYHDPDKRRQIPVATQLEQAPEIYRSADHVILFATHEGIMASDLSSYYNWNIVIDETPNAILSDAKDLGISTRLLKEFIDLRPTTTQGWSQAVLNSNAPSQLEIHKDECLKSLADLFKRLRSDQAVYFNIENWTELSNRNKRLAWVSQWSLSQLGAFKSITLAGSGFFKSILYKVMLAREPDAIQYTKELIATTRQTLPDVTIRYFTSGHRGSTAYWKTADGKDCLKAISNYFNQRQASDYYWSANDGVSTSLRNSMKGVEVSPKQEGSNSLKHYPSAVMIYSNKSQAVDAPIRSLYNLSEDDIEAARETEDLIQFVMRGSIRDQSSSHPYTIYVYDSVQAERLKVFFNSNQIAAAKTEPVMEAGIMHVCRAPRGRKPTLGISETIEQRRARYKESDRIRQAKKRERLANDRRANKSYRGRGRPTNIEVQREAEKLLNSIGK